MKRRDRRRKGGPPGHRHEGKKKGPGKKKEKRKHLQYPSRATSVTPGVTRSSCWNYGFWSATGASYSGSGNFPNKNGRRRPERP
jgi:hypothetical protein